jgi:hypothetical protein
MYGTTSTPDEDWGQFDSTESVRPVRPTRRGKVIGMGAAVLCAVGGMGLLWAEADRPGNGSDPNWNDTRNSVEFTVPVHEDEPGWNCWTMGNESCEGTLTYFYRDGQPEVLGAVLSAASDGYVYVAWSDGWVSPATKEQREAAWVTCVANADGSDASMESCDADFQNPEDRFDMRSL